MEKADFPDRNSLKIEFDKLLPLRNNLVRDLELSIADKVSSLSSTPRVQGRIKSFDSFFRKYIKIKKNHSIEHHEISDVIGIRVICPFLEDLAKVEEVLKENYEVVEVERKGGDHTFREFGYESIHLLISIPEQITNKYEMKERETAEIQIRTILQDAWAEVEHELVYKAEFTPFDNPLKRKLAAVNATLSLADIIFQEIRSYQRELNGELEKRRDSFFKKIEESTDAVLFLDGKRGAESDVGSFQADIAGHQANSLSNVSIDELLLNALYAHNKNQFDNAITIYHRILELKPDDFIRALIYKHRGMAHFACSHYEEAISDFDESLKLDPQSYKSAYYQGVICTVLRRYSEAIDAFNHSLEINPYQPYCLFRRSQAFYHLGDSPQALGDCEAALALEPFEAAEKLKKLLLDNLKM